MLQPKKTKYRKSFTRRSGLKGKKSDHIAFGTYALKAMTAARVTSRQIEAARRAMTNATKRGGKIWIRIFPHTPVTQKSAEVPMGSGKGSIDRYVAFVLPGTILFEMEGISEELAREAMRVAGYKLPVKTKIITKTH